MGSSFVKPRRPLDTGTGHLKTKHWTVIYPNSNNKLEYCNTVLPSSTVSIAQHVRCTAVHPRIGLYGFMSVTKRESVDRVWSEPPWTHCFFKAVQCSTAALSQCSRGLKQSLLSTPSREIRCLQAFKRSPFMTESLMDRWLSGSAQWTFSLPDSLLLSSSLSTRFTLENE